MKTNELPKPPRQKTSVVIEGLDTSTPDDLVKDGKCETLHNLRYKEGAWRPVHPHKENHRLNEEIAAELEIVYHHPAAGEDAYIAYYKEETETFALISLPPEGEPIITPFATVRDVVNISHFGNVLIFETTNSVYYYLLVNGVYKVFTFPPYARTSVSSFSSKYSDAAQVRIGDRQAGLGYPWEDFERETIQGVNSVWNYRGAWFPIHNITQDYPCLADADGYWNGEILLFTTWRMADGTNLSPSPLHLLKSYGGKETNIPEGFTRSISIAPSPRDLYTARLNGTDTSSLEKYLAITIQANNTASALTYAPQNEQFTRRWLPNLRIDIPTDADLSSVTHIAVWATRIHPIFALNQNYIVGQGRDNAFDSIHEVVRTDASFISFYDKTNLADQPFYLVKETPIEDIAVDEGGNKYLNIVLSASVLANITSNTVYVPNNNVHSTISSVMLDYNMRLHSADTTTTLCRPYDFVDVLTDGDITGECHQWADVEIDNKLYTSVGVSQRGVAFLPSSPYFNVISYPDYRAKRICAEYLGGFTLKEAPANNLAWYHAPHTEDEKYPPIVYAGTRIPYHPNDNSRVHRANHIDVSAPNNPFSFPFENSYSFGSASNRILAMQSAAIEMHEMKVGELPLYVFTEEGIFALVAGSNTLYSSVAAINYDKIINPNTLAINGAIVYITEKGVHLLTSAGTQVISQPIHDANGMPPIDFLRRCKIVWPKQYNEIVLLDEESTTGEAYVYNLDAGYWSTRTLQGVKLNTDELYNDNAIYNLADEDETSTLLISLATRPIKLGNVEFKRAETIIPRMSTGANVAHAGFYLTGSVDGKNYMPLRTWREEIDPRKVNPLVFRRTPFSAKYFKVNIIMNAETGESLTTSISHIDFEWYARFLHRMR